MSSWYAVMKMENEVVKEEVAEVASIVSEEQEFSMDTYKHSDYMVIVRGSIYKNDPAKGSSSSNYINAVHDLLIERGYDIKRMEYIFD